MGAIDFNILLHKEVVIFFWVSMIAAFNNIRGNCSYSNFVVTDFPYHLLGIKGLWPFNIKFVLMQGQNSPSLTLNSNTSLSLVLL